MPGVPAPVPVRARDALSRLKTNRDKTGGLAVGLADLPLFEAAAAAGDALRQRLAAIDVAGSTPREALDLPAELKGLVG